MATEKEVGMKFTTLYIDPTVMKRIMYYAQAAEGEVSGLGTIKKDEKGRHVVNNVYLLEQESSGADTELKPEAISGLMVEMMKKDEDPGELKFWWHSHANMSVFWSGTDDTCAETLSREYAFSLVVNKAGDRRCRLDLYNPFRITFDGVKIAEIAQEDKDLKAECEKEVKEKVKSPYSRWQGWQKDEYNGYPHYAGYGRGGYDDDKYYKKNEIKSRVSIPEPLVEDIERLLDTSKTYETDGGIFCSETWKQYIFDTLKEMAEKRFEKKADCAKFGTFDKEYSNCKGKCKAKKECAYWTKFFDESEEDANKGTEIPDEVIADDEFIGMT